MTLRKILSAELLEFNNSLGAFLPRVPSNESAAVGCLTIAKQM